MSRELGVILSGRFTAPGNQYWHTLTQTHKYSQSSMFPTGSFL